MPGPVLPVPSARRAGPGESPARAGRFPPTEGVGRGRAAARGRPSLHTRRRSTEVATLTRPRRSGEHDVALQVKPFCEGEDAAPVFAEDPSGTAPGGPNAGLA